MRLASIGVERRSRWSVDAHTAIILGKLFLHVVISTETCESARDRVTGNSRNAFIVRNTHIHTYLTYLYILLIYCMHAHMHTRSCQIISSIGWHAQLFTNSIHAYLFSSESRGMSWISDKHGGLASILRMPPGTSEITRSDNHPSMITWVCTWPLHSYRYALYKLYVQTIKSSSNSSAELSVINSCMWLIPCKC